MGGWEGEWGEVGIFFTYHILLGLASQKAPGSSVSPMFLLGFSPPDQFFESPLPRRNILIKQNISDVYKNKQNNFLYSMQPQFQKL